MESKTKKCLEEEGPTHKPAAAISLVYKTAARLMIFIGLYLLTHAHSGRHFCVAVLLAQRSLNIREYRYNLKSS